LFKTLFRVDLHNRRLRRMRARVLRASNHLQSVPGTPVAYTLTYRSRGRAAWASKNITEMLNRLRRDYHRNTSGNLLKYVWVLELQKDGTPHYHVIIWDLPRKHLDSEGYWPHGMTSCDGVARSGAAYAASYATKLVQKRDAFPRGARISGYGGLTSSQREDLRVRSLSAWAVASRVVKRLPSYGGWLSADGSWVMSPYDVEYSHGVTRIYDLVHTCPLLLPQITWKISCFCPTKLAILQMQLSKRRLSDVRSTSFS